MPKSVSNVIMRNVLQKLKGDGINTKSIIEYCGVSDYEIERDNGRIAEHKHYRFMLKTKEYIEPVNEFIFDKQGNQKAIKIDLDYFLKYSIKKEYLEANTTGMTIPSLSISFLRELKIELPPKEIQDRFEMYQNDLNNIKNDLNLLTQKNQNLSKPVEIKPTNPPKLTA